MKTISELLYYLTIFTIIQMYLELYLILHLYLFIRIKNMFYTIVVGLVYYGNKLLFPCTV